VSYKQRYDSSNPIPEDEFYKFWKEVRELALRRFGTFSYGSDPVVSVLLVDRTRTGPLHFLPEPYHRDDNLADRMRAASCNVAIAAEQVRRLLDMEQYRMSEALKAKSE
jgi:hypothetical protein